MSRVFAQGRINTMTMANRFIRSATWTGMADDRGEVTPELFDLMAGLAGGGVGLIITGHAYVHPHGRHSPHQLGIDRDELLGGLTKMADTVHSKGGRIAVQLGYGGAYLSRSRIRSLSEDRINTIIDAYAAAARRAVKAGFDGVQVLAAHGFLLSQFLCPRYNDRIDQYGGDIDNRARLLLQVTRAIRQTVGDQYPLFVKLNCEDFVENGMSLEDSLQVAGMLEAGGIDAIELSGGLLNNPNLLRNDINCVADEAYFRGAAKRFKERISVPLILVGGIRSLGVAEQLVEEGAADFIGMCRPFIREPQLVNRWRSGDTAKARCISCNNCVEIVKAGKCIACIPVEKPPELTFFAQEVRKVTAGPPHKRGSRYVVSKGLAKKGTRFFPVIKIEMEYQSEITGQGLTFALEGDDYERVSRIIAELREK